MNQIKVYLNNKMIGMFDASPDWDKSTLITEVNLRYGTDAWNNFEVVKGECLKLTTC